MFSPDQLLFQTFQNNNNLKNYPNHFGLPNTLNTNLNPGHLTNFVSLSE